MKIFASLLLIVSASAFAPSPSFLRPTTAASMLLEPDGIQHLAGAAEHATDALRVVLMDCDNQDCTMVDGWRDNTPAHEWHYNNRLDGNEWGGAAADHNVKALMYEYDDCE